MSPRSVLVDFRSLAPCPRVLRRAAALGLALAVVAFVGAPAAAQRARRAADPEQRLAHLTQRLELSEEQQGRIRPILEEENRELRELFEKARASGERGPLRDKAREIRTRNDERIEAELGEEQKQSFRALREEQRQRVEQRKQQRDAAGGGKQQP